MRVYSGAFGRLAGFHDDGDLPLADPMARVNAIRVALPRLGNDQVALYWSLVQQGTLRSVEGEPLSPEELRMLLPIIAAEGKRRGLQPPVSSTFMVVGYLLAAAAAYWALTN